MPSATSLLADLRSLEVLQELSESLPPEIAEQGEGIKFSEIADLDLRARVMSQVFALGKAAGSYTATVRASAEAAGLFRFGDLVANQPQLVASADLRRRDDLAGPDQLTATFTYERGFANVKRMLEQCGDDRRKGGDDFLRCYQDYLQTRTRAIDAGNRLSFSLDLTVVDDYSKSLAADGVALELDGTTKLIGKAAYGRNLWVDEDGEVRGHFDLSARYEYVDEEDVFNRRGVATATYSQKLVDGTSAVFGISWASDPELLTDVQHEVSAHVGLTYKLVKAKSKT
jgi:hypothetical protein